jgi:two-component system chemotaxis sensor kinase CheA
MVVETGEGRFGFVVDRVLGSCQTVIKNLGRFYRHVQVVSGATILGNGTVALILDPERLAQDALRSTRSRSRGHPAAAVNIRTGDGSPVNAIHGFPGADQSAGASQ